MQNPLFSNSNWNRCQPFAVPDSRNNWFSYISNMKLFSIPFFRFYFCNLLLLFPFRIFVGVLYFCYFTIHHIIKKQKHPLKVLSLVVIFCNSIVFSNFPLSLIIIEQENLGSNWKKSVVSTKSFSGSTDSWLITMKELCCLVSGISRKDNI